MLSETWVKYLTPSKEELEWSKLVKVKTKQGNEELRRHLEQARLKKQGTRGWPLDYRECLYKQMQEDKERMVQEQHQRYQSSAKVAL